jgi:isopentenyl-diphosphate delta-isomerase
MSDDEILEIINEQGRVLGAVTKREAEENNHLTQNVLVFIFTPNGNIWIQKRPITKRHFPGLWDISVCGGIIQGETADMSAQRELREEMGITCELYFVEKFLNEFPGGDTLIRRKLSHIFIGMSDQKPVVSEEVDEFKYLTYHDLKKEIESSPKNFVPSFLLELNKAYTAAHKLGWSV